VKKGRKAKSEKNKDSSSSSKDKDDKDSSKDKDSSSSSKDKDDKDKDKSKDEDKSKDQDKSEDPSSGSGGGSGEALCRPGEVSNSKNFQHKVFFSESNSYDACLKDCAANSDCVAFDYTKKSGSDSCRGVKDGGPRGGGDGYHRNFCVMIKGKGVKGKGMTSTATRAGDGYACGVGQIAPTGKAKNLGQSGTDDFDGCAKECKDTSGCKAFDVVSKSGSKYPKDACRLLGGLSNKAGGGGDGLRFFCVMK